MLSIGNELKDGYKTTSNWVNNGIEWLGDIEDFYRARATIEKEYAAKLNDLCKTHFEKKAKNSVALTVGDHPHVTPGSLEGASVVMWNEVLSQTEAIAQQKTSFANELNLKVSENLAALKSKSKGVAKRVAAIDDFLVSERDKVDQEVTKAKKNYDSLCQHTETARQKNEKSPSDKHQRKLQERETEMNNGKNDYIIKINLANRLKDKYYFQDVPELLDYLQELNESRVALLNKLLKNASIVERNSEDVVKEKLHSIDVVIDQNNPPLDTGRFIKHNIVDWQEPPDYYFIPSAIWHDDESLATKEPELTTLKKRLNVASTSYSRFENECLDAKQKLEESALERQRDKENITLKFDASFATSLTLLNKFMLSDTQRVRSEVEIELIQNYAGDKDLSYTGPVRQKKSRFGFLRGKKQNNDASDAQSLHTVKSASSHHTINKGVFNLRRPKTKSSSVFDDGSHGRALYQYAAAGDDEISMEAGDTVKIVDADDGSGWTLIESKGATGLVPTSYIEISQPPATTGDEGKKKGPSVAPKRGSKRVQYLEALYDYAADGDDEISLQAGDRIVLTQQDTDGSGWTEGELNGAKGLFPTSYVKKID